MKRALLTVASIAVLAVAIWSGGAQQAYAAKETCESIHGTYCSYPEEWYRQCTTSFGAASSCRCHTFYYWQCYY